VARLFSFLQEKATVPVTMEVQGQTTRIASLRYGPQGKSYAQMLLDLPVRVPAAWLAAGGPLSCWSGQASASVAGSA
jgi:hypothetical protein